MPKKVSPDSQIKKTIGESIP